MEIADLNLSVRTFNAVCRAGLMNISDLRQWQQYRREDLENWIGKQALAEIDEAFANMKEEHMIEITTKLPPAPAEAATPEYLEAFNLNARIHYCKDSVERGLAEMCVGIEKMRDGKQYKVLGYSNFEEYCQTEFGFTRKNGERYASIGKMLTGENATLMSQNAESIGMTKLSLLAKLDEPTREAVTETVDVETTTVKELRNEINRITSENADLGQKLDAVNEKVAIKEKQFLAAMESKSREVNSLSETNRLLNEKFRKKHDEWVRTNGENAALTGRISDLEEQIKELENRPVEVAVSVEEAKEIERLRSELDDAKLRLVQAEKIADTKTQKAVDEARHKLTQVHEQELETLREGYEKQLAEGSKKPDRSAIDRGRFYALKNVFEEIVDELESLLDELHDDPRIRYINELDNYWTDNLLYLKREGEGTGK